MGAHKDGLNVLLVSAVESLDPASGDVTYTKELLASPPLGVRYVTYDQAMERGWLRERGTRSYVAGSDGPRKLRALGGSAVRKLNIRTRDLGLGFRETIRHFEVVPGKFDLIHLHVFHARFHGQTPPLVASSAGPLETLYRDAWGWSATQLRVAVALDRVAGARADATMCSVRQGRAERLIAFNEYQRQWMQRVRHIDPDLVDVVPNYLRDPAGGLGTAAERRAVPVAFGMIARDFDGKGGASVLAAFRRLRRAHPGATLHVLGSEPQLGPDESAALGVGWTTQLPRAQVLGQFLPTIDVLLHPSRVDGFPYGPMEALAFGIPVITSDYRALPELAANGAGLVVPVDDDAQLEQRMEQLLVPERWRVASKAARAHFLRSFDSASQSVKLGESYRRALGTRFSD